MPKPKRQPNPYTHIREDAFTSTTIRWLQLKGFRVMHPQPAEYRGRWQTRNLGDNGYPDVTAVGHGIVVWLELKSESGRIEPDQAQWAAEIRGAMAAAPAAIIFRVLKPSQWDEFADELDARIGKRERAA